MNEDIQFLKELQQELKTQENDGQASPRYWSIMDYKWEPTSEDHAEDMIIFDSDACETLDLADYIEEVLHDRKDEFEEDEIEDLEFLREFDSSPNEFYEWIEQHDDNRRYYPVYQQEISYIAYNTCFFTKEEAKRHLENNRHHYSSKAHTFAMTAWRAPKMERLMEILETFDWDSLSS